MPGPSRCHACGREITSPQTHQCPGDGTETLRAQDRIAPRDRTGPSVGDVVAGRWALLSEVGAGGGGTVYKAMDRELGAQVALKVLHPLATSDALRRRFRREIRVTRAIDHPSVSRVFDLGESGGLEFLTMRWIDGESLQKRVREGGPLPAPALRRLAGGLVSALAATHRRGVVHRDVKPANVLVSVSGEPVLVDFGIATEASVSPSGDPKRSLDRITLDGQIPGTPAFMAPEQLDGDAVTPAADLWSLALTLTYAATGEPGLPSDPERALRGFVRPLRSILVRCLEVDPALRPRDALQIQRDLATSVRRRRLLRTASVVLGIALVAAAGGFLSATGPEATPLVYVRPLENATGDRGFEWLEHGVADLVSARLETSGHVRIALDAEARADAARVEGRIATTRGRPAVLLTLRAPGGEVRARARISPPNGEALFQGIDDAVARFLAALDVRGTSAASVEALPRPDTNDPNAWADYARARELIRQHKEREALDALRAATARDPTFALAHLELHVLIQYARVGPQSEGDEALRLAREHRHRLLPDQLEFVDAVLEACTPGEVPAKYDRLLAYLRSHPPEPWKYQTAYRVYFDTPATRIPFLLEWIARLPDDPEPHNQLGYIHFQNLHDSRAAEQDFKTYLRLAPDLANAHDSYAEFLRAEGRLEESAREFDRALAIDPLFSNSAFGAIDVAIRRGNLADAERRIARGRAAIPVTVAQFENWVLAYASVPMLRGHPEEGERRLERIVADPTVGSRAYIARSYQAVLAALQGDASTAGRFAEESERLRLLYHGAAVGRSALPLYVAGLAAFRRGDGPGIQAAIRAIGEGEWTDPQPIEETRRLLEGLALRRSDPSAAAERLRGVAGGATYGAVFLAALERARALSDAGRPVDALGAYGDADRLVATGILPEVAALRRELLLEAIEVARRIGNEAKQSEYEAKLAALDR